MSFYKYSNVNQRSSEGWTAGDLMTDDPALMAVSSSAVNKYMYINGIAFGKILGVGSNPPGTYTLQRWSETWGVLDVTDTPLVVTWPFVGFVVQSNNHYNTPITSVEIKDEFLLLTKVGSATTTVVIYSSNAAVIAAQNDALVGQKIYNGSTLIGTVTTNMLFNGNDPSVSTTTVVEAITGAIVNLKSKVLMAITIQLDTTIGTIANLPTANTLVVGAAATSGTTNTWSYGATPYAASPLGLSYGVLYYGGSSILDNTPASLAIDNDFLWSAIADGSFGLHIDGTFVGPVCSLNTGFNYIHNTNPAAELPFSHKVNPWAHEKLIAAYSIANIHGILPFSGSVSNVQFKPYYWSKLDAAGKFRISVAGPPVASTYNSDMIDAVKACVLGSSLYINGECIGTISAWGNQDWYINGVGPMTFKTYKAAAGITDGYPAFQEYYLEVAIPVKLPKVDQNIYVSLTPEAKDAPKFVNGVAYLINLPPIKEGVNGLVGKRLIINEIFVGIVASNTLASITTTTAGTKYAMPDIYGVWCLKTTDNAGRAPLCVSSQISLCDWPSYPIIQLTNEQYNTPYDYSPLTVTRYPNNESIYTRRIAPVSGSTTSVLLRHDLPKWVEHAHVSPEQSKFILAEDGTADLDQPFRAFYTVQPSTFIATELPKMWQNGHVVQVSYDAAVACISGSYWTYPIGLDRGYLCKNYRGQLQGALVLEEANAVTDHITLAASNIGRMPVNTTILTNTGALTLGAWGLLDDNSTDIPVGTSVWTGHIALVPSTGMLIPEIVILAADGSAVAVLANGLLPADTLIATGTGTVAVAANGLLPAGTDVAVLDNLQTVQSDGKLPLDTILNLADGSFRLVQDITSSSATPSLPYITYTYVIPAGQLIPEGTVIYGVSQVTQVLENGQVRAGVKVLEEYLGTPAPGYGVLPADFTVVIPTGTTDADINGLLTPGLPIVYVYTTITVGATGLLPEGTIIITENHQIITVPASGQLPEGTVLTTLNEVPIPNLNMIAIVYADGKIRPGANLIIDIGIGRAILTVPETGLVPEGTDILTPNGQIVTVGVNGAIPIGTILAAHLADGEDLVLPHIAGKLPPVDVVITATGSVSMSPRGLNFMELPPGTVCVTQGDGRAVVDEISCLPIGTVLQDGTVITAMDTITIAADGVIPRNEIFFWFINPVTTYNTHGVYGSVHGGAHVGMQLIGPTGLISVPADKLLIPGTELEVYRKVVIPIVPSSKTLLASCTVLERLKAPEAILLTGSVLQCTTGSEPVTQEFSLVQITGPRVESLASSVQYISVELTIDSVTTTLLTPAVTTEVQITTAAGINNLGTLIQLTRGHKVNLPTHANLGQALVTLDTGELFIGTGTGVRKIADVIVSETEPVAADRSKLWFDPGLNVTKIYKDGSWQQTNSDAAQDYGVF